MYNLIDTSDTTPDLVAPKAEARFHTTTLPVSARDAYEAFCEADHIPRWIPSIRSAQVLAWTQEAKPSRVAFLASAANSTLGFTLDYVYSDSSTQLGWRTANKVVTEVEGFARFSPMGARACLFEYTLTIDSPNHTFDPARFIKGHPVSTLFHSFRDYLRNHLHL